jgi:hypothetical protein
LWGAGHIAQLGSIILQVPNKLPVGWKAGTLGSLKAGMLGGQEAGMLEGQKAVFAKAAASG